MRNALLCLGLLTLGLPSAAEAQRSGSGAVKTETLTTKDGVSLAASYYPSKRGEQATPVVMLHDYRESRAVYDAFARRLQTPEQADDHDSFAVLTIDLRGHGGSMTQTAPGSGARAGAKRQLETSKLRKGDFEAMVLRDMEAVRKFLVGENDAGRLNLNRLSIVGTGLGASVALNWAAVDWSMRPLATVKQGQDVKALILVSPRWKSNGLVVQNALRQPGVRQQVATMLLFGGKERRNKADAERIYKQLERYREIKPSSKDDLPTLVKFGPETELQGSEWLKQAGKKGEDLMIRFLTQHAAEPELERIVRRTD